MENCYKKDNSCDLVVLKLKWKGCKTVYSIYHSVLSISLTHSAYSFVLTFRLLTSILLLNSNSKLFSHLNIFMHLNLLVNNGIQKATFTLLTLYHRKCNLVIKSNNSIIFTNNSNQAFVLQRLSPLLLNKLMSNPTKPILCGINLK